MRFSIPAVALSIFLLLVSVFIYPIYQEANNESLYDEQQAINIARSTIDKIIDSRIFNERDRELLKASLTRLNGIYYYEIERYSQTINPSKGSSFSVSYFKEEDTEIYQKNDIVKITIKKLQNSRNQRLIRTMTGKTFNSKPVVLSAGVR